MEQALRIHVYIEIFNSSNKNMHFERLSFKQKSKKRKKTPKKKAKQKPLKLRLRNIYCSK